MSPLKNCLTLLDFSLSLKSSETEMIMLSTKSVSGNGELAGLELTWGPSVMRIWHVLESLVRGLRTTRRGRKTPNSRNKM